MSSTLRSDHEEMHHYLHRFPKWHDELWQEEHYRDEILEPEINDGEVERCGDDLECELRSRDHEEQLQGLPVVAENTRTSLEPEKTCAVLQVLDGKTINDIPAVYRVPTLQSHEFAAVGVWIDKRIVPGFKYRVRTIENEEYEDEFIFGGNGLLLQSIGYGYSRRITFKPGPGQMNNNANYFYSDSRQYGFAFQPELVSVGEKYTIYDVSHHPVGHLEVIKIQHPQEEISHTVFDDQSVEKIARIQLIAKVEWFDNNEVCAVSISGNAISIKKKNCLAQVSRIAGVMISRYPRRNYTLYPGIDNKKRCIIVNGAACRDIPVCYSVVGIETYELPVIATYIHPRILPGFCYKVRPINSKQYLFDGRALRLVNIGIGYSKRLTFAPEPNCLNSNYNYFWTDSHPSGFGFELRAVHSNSKFTILADSRRVGYASVSRVDYPQYEEHQLIEKHKKGITINKYVHVEVTCQVTIDLSASEKAGCKICEDRVMRISGTAVLQKISSEKEAKLLRMENIGLDSQLNLLFFAEHTNLIFKAEE